MKGWMNPVIMAYALGMICVAGAARAADATTATSSLTDEQYQSVMTKLNSSMSTTVTTTTGSSVSVDLESSDTTSGDTSKTVSVVSLVEDTMKPECISYKLNGICFWLYCHYGCWVKTSLSVTHYNPDAIVETISEDTTTPVEWLTGLFDSAFSAAGKVIMGHSLGTGVKTADKRSSLNSYDVNVYGNPALLVYRDVVGSMMELLAFCKSGVQPFQPYFVSKIDPDWRLGVGEALLSVLPSNYDRELASSNQDVPGSKEAFGDIYPRTSSVNKENRFLGSMVIAQRAANIAGGSPAIHITTQLPKTVSGYKTWAPNDIEEGKEDIAKWQRNFPRGNTSCKAFPISMSTAYPYSSSDYSSTQNYLYTLWRRYECCKKRGTFISRVTY